MAPLILARLAFRIEKVGNRGAAHRDGPLKNDLKGFSQGAGFGASETNAEFGRVNSGAPEALIGVDVADTPEHRLVQKQSLHARAAPADARGKFFGIDEQWFGAKSFELGRKRSVFEVGDPAEAARVGVAQLATIIKKEANMGVLFLGLSWARRGEVSRHSKVNKECSRLFAILCDSASGQSQKHEFAVTLNACDGLARKKLLQRARIIDEIGFPKPDGKNASAGDGFLQSARDGFNFRKFRHFLSK